MHKIYDCITFFKENFVTDLRLQILKENVHKFIICESVFDHRGKKKDINFILKDQSLKNKVHHIIIDHPFPNPKDPWSCQKYQRDFIIGNLQDCSKDDYVMFSDPDEIPCPKILNHLNLKKKYGIFLQKHLVYKFNILNQYENPWAGTRVCKKKHLKSIDDLKHRILLKNLKKWWRIDKERSIQIIDNGGWHFNNFLSPNDISLKLRTYAHTEYDKPNLTNQEIIKSKIDNMEDVFGRGWNFKKFENINELPEYIIQNKIKFLEYF